MLTAQLMILNVSSFKGNVPTVAMRLIVNVKSTTKVHRVQVYFVEISGYFISLC